MKMISLLLFVLLSVQPIHFSYASDIPEMKENMHNDFIKEWIVLEETYSSDINEVKLDLQLPENYQILPKAEGYIRLYTKNRELIRQPIVDLQTTILLNQKIEDDRLFAEAKIGYCKVGREGLCLLKYILFEIPIASDSQVKDLILKYAVTEIVFEYDGFASFGVIDGI